MFIFYFFFLDVDTHEIDEKSIITYISSLYDVFPEPPAVHPLYDSVMNFKMLRHCYLLNMFEIYLLTKYQIIDL